MKQIAKCISTGFYTGLFPFAPGTFASLCYCLLHAFLVNQQGLYFFSGIIFIALLTAISLIATRIYIADSSFKDPKEVVIDEWLGMSFALFALPDTNHFFFRLTIAFLLFRFFDIYKPWPISKAESLPGATGIMADDILAGLISAALLKIIISLGYL